MIRAAIHQFAADLIGAVAALAILCGYAVVVMIALCAIIKVFELVTPNAAPETREDGR